MANKSAGALPLFSVLALLALVLVSSSSSSSSSSSLAGAAEVPVRAEIQVTRNGISTQKDGVVHARFSSAGRAGGFSGGGRGGGSSRGGSPGGSRGGSKGKPNRGASGLPYGGGSTSVGGYGDSRKAKHNGGSRRWSSCLVFAAAATVFGIVSIVA